MNEVSWQSQASQPRSPLSRRLLGYTVGLIAWGVTIKAALAIRDLPVPSAWQHLICGPWGCGPTITDTLAWQGAVTAMLALPCGMACWRWRPRLLERVGWGIAVPLLVLSAVWLVRDTWTWLPEFYPQRLGWLGRKYLHSLLESADFPILPLMACGLVMAWAGRRRSRGVDATGEDGD